MILPTEVRFGPQTKFAIFGKTFNTSAEAEKHRDETIARREKIAGRQLSESELLRGIRTGRKPGWETPGERIGALNWQPIRTPAGPKPIKIEPTEEYRPGRPMPPKQRAALSQQQYEDRKAREAGIQSPADPTREAAKEYARSVWEKVAFSPHSTDKQVAQADQLLKQADYDLTTFAKMSDDFAAQTLIQHAERTVAMEKQIADVAARNSALEPLPRFVAPETPADDSVESDN